MKTTLPTLSYKPTGCLLSEDTHICMYTKEQACPQTDLEHIIQWYTFETEIYQDITTHMAATNIPSDAKYDIRFLQNKQPLVESKEAVWQQATVQLYDLLLDILGIEGCFSLPDSGNNKIIGEPDFSWLWDHTKHPKVVVHVSMIIVFARPYLYKTDRVQDKMGDPSWGLARVFST